MNPSATGWIKKLLKLIDINSSQSIISDEDFYNNLRTSGFIYGTNVQIVSDFIIDKGFTEEEMCKVNLCLAFLHAFKKNNHTENFAESVVGFYKSINEHKLSFFKEIIGNKKRTEHLEHIFHNRTQIADNVFTKNFNYLLINGLLYVDILAYEAYLKDDSSSLEYIKKLESCIEAISLDVIKSKKKKTVYDKGLIRLFESSMRYKTDDHLEYKTALAYIQDKKEKLYIFDLACMATWSDQIIESSEQKFLLQLGQDLELSLSDIEESISTINDFYISNKNQIALFSSKNMMLTFYGNSTKIVTKLITRNRKRLYQELLDSKELMILLTQSTVRDLNKQEQKKVNEQLLDIFKSIPSLAIFLLPGGMLLLPIVIKFIPKLLPSAFDENRIEEDH